MKKSIPIIKLSKIERIWLNLVYTKNLAGEKFTHKEIWSALHQRLPQDFRPFYIDSRLIDSSGEHIRLLGIVALNKNITFLSKVNKLVKCIREHLLANHSVERISAEEITSKTGLTTNEVTIILQVINEFGNFYRGCSHENDINLIKSIDIASGDDIYYEYIGFKGIEKLIHLKEWTTPKPTIDLFSYDEMAILIEKIDTLEEQIKRLALGQEIIWTDVMIELNELKTMFSLPKKDWRQIFFGKIMEMTFSGILNLTVSQKIVDFFNPLVAGLLKLK